MIFDKKFVIVKKTWKKMDGGEWLVSRFDPLDVRLDETHR
jgi:hypothetical protein